MNLSLMEMRLAIHQTHDCEAKECVEIVSVKTSQPDNVQAVDVYVFQIEGHPSSRRCFTWIIPESRDRIVVPAVIMTPETQTAADAVEFYQIQFGR